MNNLSKLFTLVIIASLTVSCSKDDDNRNSNNGGGGSTSTGCSGGPSTVTDIDGNVYNVVSIGNQCWMKENLKTTRFKNGQSISNSLSATSGRLYDWYTVSDPNGLCPSGWHVPDTNEFKDLVVSIDPSANLTMNTYNSFSAGGHLKSVSGWNSPNTGADNSSGFSALPDGSYYTAGSGGYYGAGQYAYFWTSDDCTGANPWSWILYYDQSSIASSNYLHGKSGKISVRCVKD